VPLEGAGDVSEAGATGAAPEPAQAPPAWAPGGAAWDPEYAALSRSDLLPRLARQAFGDQYPQELRPYGFTTWPLLREIGKRLGIRAGQTLLDLGTGEGGIGLWLAQEHGARLIALDFSAEALRAAALLAHRLHDQVKVPVQREYRHATLTETGLRSTTVDTAVCLDALQYCADKIGALRELHRVLRPGGRFALTAPEILPDCVRAEDVSDYRPLIEEAGLRVLHHAEIPGWREPTRRNFELWLGHADRLRAELGPTVAATLLDEAADVIARLPDRRYMLIVGARQ
jgi:SAM-dependent methyltransferase